MMGSPRSQRNEVVDVALLSDRDVHFSIQVDDIGKAKLAKNLDQKSRPLICCLSRSRSIITLTDVSDSGTCITISEDIYSDFAWEETTVDLQSGSNEFYRLITVGSTFDLRLYTVDPENLKSVQVESVPACSPHMLGMMVESKDMSLTDLVSLKLLSFSDSHCFLLLNSCVLVQLLWQREYATPEMVSTCSIILPLNASQKCEDYQICRGMLFVLTNSGATYMFDSTEGQHLATVDFGLFPKDVAWTPDFCLLEILQDLSMAVAVTGLNVVIAVDLNEYFRTYPDHLHSQKVYSHLSFKPQDTSDQEDLLSSSHSRSVLDLTFHNDCSWESQLTSLNSRAKMPTPLFQQMPISPWYKDSPHIECRQAIASAKNSRESERLWCGFVIEEVPAQATPLMLSVSKFSAVLTVVCPFNKSTLVVYMDLASQNITSHYTDTSSLPIQLSSGEQHCLLLKESGLSLVLFGVSQEELLNRLMVFGSAGTVDSLCHLNAWGRCSIPIHALQAGLKNHQLDTVDFFLKSKENILSPRGVYSALEQTPAVSTHLQVKNIQELCPALDLLCSAIRDTHTESQSKQFSEQLLSITYTFLSTQVRSILSGTEDLDQNLQACVKMLEGYISDLRNYLRMPSWDIKCDRVVTTPLLEEEEEEMEDMFHLPVEEIIQHAVTACRIPWAQAFLRRQASPELCLEDLKRSGLLQVYCCLQRQDLVQATSLLRSMGYCVKEQLYSICIHTEDKNLRDFLVEMLSSHGYLSDEELLKVELLRKIEEPTALSYQPQKNKRVLDMGHVDPECNSLLQQFACESAGMLSHNLCNLLRLDWVSHWDSYTQSSILLSQKKVLESSCESEVLWTYLTSHHDQNRVIEWIRSLVINKNSTVSPPWPTLTAGVVSSSTQSNTFLRNLILDLLARQGEFIQTEMDNFEQLLWRLAQAGGVMQVTQIPQLCSQMHNFHTTFIDHCLEIGLCYLLYIYINSNRNYQVLEEKGSCESHPCFEMLVKIQDIVKDLTDPEKVFQGSLTSARVLIPGSQGSVSSMLLEGHSLLALSTIMFAPGGIDQVSQHTCQVGDCPWRADPQLLKMALSTYPKLKFALFPPSGPFGMGLLDVSIYHLMQSLNPMDSSRLFWWQSANTLGITEMSAELPHFSTPSLVSKYALLENLDFLHHLRNGRPSFAYGTFLVQHLANFSDEKILLTHAAELAYGLGLQHFNSPSVAAACVCFCELLGVYSLKLRVDIKAFSLLLKFLKKNSEGNNVRSLKECLIGKCSQLESEWNQPRGLELLNDLEKAVKNTVENRCISRSSHEALQEWALPVQFSQLHALTLTTVYPCDCAADGEWLYLLLFVQQHSYPPQQVRALVTSFCPALQTHLTLAFQDLQAPLQSLHEEVLEHMEALGREEYVEPSKELFQVVLQSQGQQCPWRYQLGEAMAQHCPPLTIFAACEKESELLQFLCVWILTSIDLSITQEATTHIDESLSQHEWNLHDLAIIWKILLKNFNIMPLVHGFQLFLRKSPLLHMLNLYLLCCDAKKYEEAKTKLQEFQKCLFSLREGVVQSPVGIPVEWIESQASVLLRTMIQQCGTQYELRRLLQLMCDMGHLLRSNGPDFKTLSQLSQVLQGTPVSLSPQLLEGYCPDVLQRECQKMLQELQALGYFSHARQVADLAHLSIDDLIITELRQHLHSLKNKHQWERKDVRLTFLRRCHDQFRINRTNIEAASGFFLSLADQSQSECHQALEMELLCMQECCVLFSLAGFWLSQQECPSQAQLEQIEKKLWRCRVNCQLLVTDLRKDSLFVTPLAGNNDSFEEMVKAFSFSKVPALGDPKYLSLDDMPSAFNKEISGLLDVKEQSALSALLGRLLDDGCIYEASRVCRYFHYYCPDVQLVLRCRGLASGEHQRDIQELFTTDTKKSPQSYSSLGSLSSFVVVPSPEDQVVSQLRTLVNECRHGKNYCKQVLSLYELSKELNCSYSEMSAAEPEAVLQKILLSQHKDRYKTAQVFISVQGMQSENVAQLISSFVVQGIQASAQEGEFGDRQIYCLPEGREAFRQLAKLCGDPNLVGIRLLDHISTLPLSELSCMVELLILAHDCFSLSCNMEGIVQVLQAARHVSHVHLAHSDRHGLLVRLLTGIGRYNEMTYIFDLLNQNHCFEMLLRKKVESNTRLKTALLDYIKRCLPCDSEKHNMVALCFSMCREIGENHEGAARTQLKIIESQPWVVTVELKSALIKVQTLFKDAAESLFKDSCVRQAVRCVKMAKLVTLQLHLLNHGHSQRVINLRPSELLNAILELPHCYQVLVVTEAYDFSPDWAEVLYQRVILKGDFLFLEEFKLYIPMQASLFEEISKKLTQHRPPNASQNLRKFLQHCEDIYTYYKLAYDHKFFDVANMLLQDSKTSSYLNDRLIS